LPLKQNEDKQEQSKTRHVYINVFSHTHKPQF